MISVELIKSIIVDWQEQQRPIILPRKTQLPVNSNEIVTVIGPRRSGKTFLLFGKIQSLIKSGLTIKDIIYINFEDERLYGMKLQDLDLIIQASRLLDSNNTLDKKYFFFDEIQNVVGWEKFVRRMDDSISKNIYITGSNSKLLSSEIATSLRGRTLKTEVSPLSFYEFLNFVNISNNYDSSINKAKIINAFNDYLQIGGFPRIVLNTDNSQRIQLLQEYYNVMIQKDIQERYNIHNTLALKFFCNQIINNHSGIVSINKIFNAAKSSQIKVSLETYYNIFEYIQNIYLIGILKKYSNSLRLRDSSEKKVYIIDNGLYNAVNQSPSKNTGKLLEASVFYYFNSKYDNNDISFYKGLDFECDFVLHQKGKTIEAFQVTVEMTDQKTKDRELKGLIKTCKDLDLINGTIITLNYEELITVDAIQIKIIPAWKYFLS